MADVYKVSETFLQRARVLAEVGSRVDHGPGAACSKDAPGGCRVCDTRKAAAQLQEELRKVLVG